MIADLIEHCVAFRKAVDHLVDEPLTSAEDWRSALRSVWITASALYLDFATLSSRVAALFDQSRESTNTDASAEPDRAKLKREYDLRQRLEARLDRSAIWQKLDTYDAFAEWTGLKVLQDYTNNVTLHLPEVAEGSREVEASARIFLETADRDALLELILEMDHIGRNHIQFVLPTLERAVAGVLD